MFEQFSSGYYLGRLYLEPHDGEQAVMHRGDHEAVNEQLYTDGEGIERVDLPLVMKVGSAHVPVHGEEGIPQQTLALPAATLEEAGIRNPPELSEVLLAKKEVAAQMLGGWGTEAAGV